MMLLNPGPVNVSDRVRKALIHPDICHRENECAELIHNIRTKLLQAFVPKAQDEYTAILLTGSGTAAVEASIFSSLPQGKRMLVINNGVYGQRLTNMAATQRLAIPELKYDWTVQPDPEKVRTAMLQHPEVYVVSMVHHETTLGLINPVHEVAKIVDSLNRVFLLDSVSGLGGEELDITGPHIYMVAGTAGKCIQGFPGVSFVIVRKGFMERIMKFPKRSWYLNLANYYEEQEHRNVPFTPGVPVYYAFHEALSELLEEGVSNRIRRYQQTAQMIRGRMNDLGIKPVLDTALMSHSLTAYFLPESLSYQVLHDQLKERGYVIYAGQGHLESKIFRVANMGALTEKDFEGFLEAFEEVLKQQPSSVS